MAPRPANSGSVIPVRTRPGRDGVDPDVGRALPRQLAGERHDGALRRAVGRVVVVGRERRRRRDVDDRAAALLAHDRQDVLADEERAAGVDGHHPVPVVERPLLDRTERGVAGGVEHAVDAPELLARRLDGGAHRRLVGDVGAEADRAVDAGGDLLRLGRRRGRRRPPARRRRRTAAPSPRRSPIRRRWRTAPCPRSPWSTTSFTRLVVGTGSCARSGRRPRAGSAPSPSSPPATP